MKGLSVQLCFRSFLKQTQKRWHLFVDEDGRSLTVGHKFADFQYKFCIWRVNRHFVGM